VGLIPVILCGGAGARLWPLSNEARPKPFITLPGGGTSAGETHRRAAGLDGVAHMLTVTGRDLLPLAVEAGAAVPVEHTFLLEPVSRDTAAAVAFAALHAAEEQGPDTILLVLPADHLVGDDAAFGAAVRQARDLAASERIVTFGVVPDRPETSFGYIEARDGTVLRFVEKPDAATAAAWVAGGGFLWNAGMLCACAGVLLQAMREHCPQVLDAVGRARARAHHDGFGGRSVIEAEAEAFSAAPAISIDYAVLEKMTGLACVPLACGWSDIGSWETLAGLVDADENGNRIVGPAVLESAENCFVLADGKPVGLVGVSDLVVVDTPDGLLVAHRDSAQQVKRLVRRLQARAGDNR